MRTAAHSSCAPGAPMGTACEPPPVSAGSRHRIRQSLSLPPARPLAHPILAPRWLRSAARRASTRGASMRPERSTAAPSRSIPTSGARRCSSGALTSRREITRAPGHCSSTATCQGGRAMGRHDGRAKNLRGRTLAVILEAGFGDQIQFSRFVPLIRSRGGLILLMCPSELERIYRSSLAGIDVYPVGSIPHGTHE